MSFIINGCMPDTKHTGGAYSSRIRTFDILYVSLYKKQAEPILSAQPLDSIA